MFKLSNMENSDENIKYDVRGIEKGTYNIIFGEPNIGKSNFIYQLAFSLANNINFLNLNDKQIKPLKIVVLSAEDSSSKIKNKIVSLQQKYNVNSRFDFSTIENNHFIVGNDVKLAKANFNNFINFVTNNDIDILFIDTLESLLEITYQDKYAGLNKVNSILDGICKKTGCTIFSAHHSKNDGTLEGGGLVKKMPRTVLKVFQPRKQDNKFFYTGLMWDKINTSMTDSLEPLRNNKGTFEVLFKVNLKGFTIENDHKPIVAKVETKLSKRDYYKGGEVVKANLDKYKTILYDRKFLKLGMFKNIKDGDELEKGVTYKYGDEKDNINFEVNMFQQLIAYDAQVYSCLLSMCADYESGTIIDHETAKVVHGKDYEANVTIDKEDESGTINSINITTTLRDIAKMMGKFIDSNTCGKIMDSLKRMNLTVFNVTNNFGDKKVTNSGKFLNISIIEYENRPLTKSLVSVTLNPINAQVLLPTTYRQREIYGDISYCLGHIEAERKLGVEASNLYMFLINLISPNQVKDINTKTLIGKLYNVKNINTISKEDLYSKRIQVEKLLFKIANTIPDHFDIERKRITSLVTFIVHRKK